MILYIFINLLLFFIIISPLYAYKDYVSALCENDVHITAGDGTKNRDKIETLDRKLNQFCILLGSRGAAA